MHNIMEGEDSVRWRSLTRVLILDDDSATSSSLTKMVTRAGFSVVCRGEKGHDVLHLVAKHAPSVMLLGLKMPSLEALATLQQVSRHYAWLPVLVISVLDANIYVQRCMRLGAKGFLTRGCDPVLLFSAITQLAQGRMVYPDLSLEAMVDQASYPTSRW